MDFFDNIDQNVEWDSDKKKKNKIEETPAKINAAPTNDVIAETPDINLDNNVPQQPTNENSQPNIGDNLFSKMNSKPSLVEDKPIEQVEESKPIDL